MFSLTPMAWNICEVPGVFIVTPSHSVLNSPDHRNSAALAAVPAWSQACLEKNKVRKNVNEMFYSCGNLLVNTYLDLTAV